MDVELSAQIHVMINERILAYHKRLVAEGQIEDIPKLAPGFVDLSDLDGAPSSGFTDYSQSEHTPPDDQQEDPTPRQDASVHSPPCEHEHE